MSQAMKFDDTRLFKVPFALDQTGELVAACDAGQDSLYYCPGCNGLLTLKSGPIKRAHFAHKPNGFCSYESVTHQLAKRMIASAVQSTKKGETLPLLFTMKCRLCDRPVNVSLPKKVTHAKPEQAVGPFIVDVALFSGSLLIAAIEIYVAHRVEQYKSNNLSIPFVELNAEDVLIGARPLLPLASTWKRPLCPQCKKAKDFLVKVSREIVRNNITRGHLQILYSVIAQILERSA